MLLPKNTNPAYSTYYYGAVVLNALLSAQKDSIDFSSLFQELNKDKKISIKPFVLALDWLYLIGAINVNSEKAIVIVKKKQNLILANNMIRLLQRILDRLDEVVLAPIEKDVDAMRNEHPDAEIEKNIDLLKDVFKVY